MSLLPAFVLESKRVDEIKFWCERWAINGAAKVKAGESPMLKKSLPSTSQYYDDCEDNARMSGYGVPMLVAEDANEGEE